MSRLPFAVAGALIWLALVEGGSLGGALFGAFAGLALERIFLRRRAMPAEGSPEPPRPGGTGTSRLRKAWTVLRLLGRFSVEILVANVQQLRLVLAPRLRVRPRWLVYRTSLGDPKLRVLLGLMISLTPGTVTADLGADRLLVHILDTDEPEAVGDRIRRRFEALLEELDR